MNSMRRKGRFERSVWEGKETLKETYAKEMKV